MPQPSRSKAALWISGIYLILGLGSWMLPLIAKPGESLAGVFLVIFAQPWSTLLMKAVDAFNLDSFALNMALMLLAVLANGWIIYKIVSLIANRKSVST